MKDWQKLLVFVALMFLVEYLSGNIINRTIVALAYHKELVLAALVAGLLSPGLNGWKHSATVYTLGVISIFAWDAALGAEVTAVPFWDPGWHWTGSWWNLLSFGLTVVEYFIGAIVSGMLFVPKDEATRCACAPE